jgi:hypothetical protein
LIPQLDVRREGERENTFVKKEREIPQVYLLRDGRDLRREGE